MPDIESMSPGPRVHFTPPANEFETWEPPSPGRLARRFATPPVGTPSPQPRRRRRNPNFKSTWMKVPVFDGFNMPFESWVTLILWKLEVNLDHFDTELSKVFYIFSCTTGEAQVQLLPICSSLDTNEPPTVARVLSYLRMLFARLHKEESAENAFDRLQMEEDEPLQLFLRRFFPLVTATHLTLGEYQHALRRRMNFGLQEALMKEPTSRDPKDFAPFVERAIHIDIMRRELLKRFAEDAAEAAWQEEEDRCQAAREAEEKRRLDLLEKINHTVVAIRQIGCYLCQRLDHHAAACPNRDESTHIALIRPALVVRKQVAKVAKKKEAISKTSKVAKPSKIPKASAKAKVTKPTSAATKTKVSASASAAKKKAPTDTASASAVKNEAPAAITTTSPPHWHSGIKPTSCKQYVSRSVQTDPVPKDFETVSKLNAHLQPKEILKPSIRRLPNAIALQTIDFGDNPYSDPPSEYTPLPRS